MGYDLSKLDELSRALRDSSEEAGQLGLTLAAYLIDVARIEVDSSLGTSIRDPQARPYNRRSRLEPPASEGLGS